VNFASTLLLAREKNKQTTDIIRNNDTNGCIRCDAIVGQVVENDLNTFDEIACRKGRRKANKSCRSPAYGSSFASTLNYAPQSVTIPLLDYSKDSVPNLDPESRGPRLRSSVVYHP
jgi:hypothetical protein